MGRRLHCTLPKVPGNKTDEQMETRTFSGKADRDSHLYTPIHVSMYA
jgi:hypothetical protein